ncbi:hypothetical protein WA026_001712 [Henosepilachna vigintioctopunctata]|uniref:Peptidyl-prolyl cis-trans isomerase n=1 Tax=Henosepilachna vigintioctopunctata TaxID=420089 RepID=A0AAW1USR9_9CUCU
MISIDKVIIGTMLFMLYDDLVPNTCRLFVKRCRQAQGGYTGTPIHRIVTPSWIQCGGYRLKEVVMPCENYAVCHDKRGVLSMCNSGNHKKNTTQFMITLEKTSWMDTHYVAFGQLLHGDWVLSQIESVPTYYQAPKTEVKIVKAGEYSLQPSKLIQGTTELQSFLDKRLKLKPKSYQNYSTIDELKLEKIVHQNEKKREYLDTDLRPYFPLEMLPENILESFNYVADKKSSCLFEVENCTKCGCSHDVGKCMRDSSSRSSISS